MQKKIPPIWPIESHTIAKHQILEDYLKAWFPIIGRWAGRIVYLDGFAGPGKYLGGEDGSPVIAIRTAIEHKMIKPSTEITFGFIEKDKKRAEILEQVLQDKFEKLPENMHYQVEKSEFVSSLESTLNDLEKKGANLAPTFAFLDPFGYSDFPIEIICKLLKYEKSEVLITFMSGFVNRFLDPIHEEAVSKLYGTKDFLKAKTISKTNERIKFLLEIYIKQLQEKAGLKYIRTFEMLGDDNKIIYQLIFCTKHWKGLEIMKKAMLRTDSRGMYSFSDKIGFHQTFFVNIKDGIEWMPNAALTIFKEFKGRTVHVEEIHKFVIIDTPYIFKKEILKFLEKSDPPKIVSVSKRKNKFLSYPNGCTIQFSSN